MGEAMLMRLDWMTIDPKLVLDVGCGVGNMTGALQARYPDAIVLGLDNEFAMTHYAKHTEQIPRVICADAAYLPLKDHSVDLIFANLLLPWCPDPKALLREWRRVLRPDGVLMLSALGPDTLREYLELLHAGMPLRVDMHDVGDLLLAEGFVDPVLDVDYYTITYRDINKGLDELKTSGMWCSVSALPDSASFLPSANEEKWCMTYEGIFAHAFAPNKSNEKPNGYNQEVRIPISQILRR